MKSSRDSVTVASPELPSEGSFGLLFSAIFALAGGYVIYHEISTALAYLFFAIGVLLLAVTILAPRLLAPLNRAWFALGLMLGRIVNPVVLGVIFFFVITPVAMMMKLAGRDHLGLHKKNVDSYWVNREPVGPDPQTFHNQF